MSALSRFLVATSSTLPRQCLSGGVLFATGDIIAQQGVERKGRDHDWVRTARLGIYGGAIFSPIAAVWLGKVLERVPFKARAANIATKVALDQGIAAPSLTALFFTATTFMAGGSKSDVKSKLNEVCPAYYGCYGCSSYDLRRTYHVTDPAVLDRHGGRPSRPAGLCGSLCRPSTWRSSRPLSVSSSCKCSAARFTSPSRLLFSL